MPYCPFYIQLLRTRLHLGVKIHFHVVDIFLDRSDRFLGANAFLKAVSIDSDNIVEIISSSGSESNQSENSHDLESSSSSEGELDIEGRPEVTSKLTESSENSENSANSSSDSTDSTPERVHKKQRII